MFTDKIKTLHVTRGKTNTLTEPWAQRVFSMNKSNMWTSEIVFVSLASEYKNASFRLDTVVEMSSRRQHYNGNMIIYSISLFTRSEYNTRRRVSRADISRDDRTV